MLALWQQLMCGGAMNQPEKPFFCRSARNDEDTDCYATEPEAIQAAEQAQMAPFTIFRLIAQPISFRATNGRKAFDERVKKVAEDVERAVTSTLDILREEHGVS